MPESFEKLLGDEGYVARCHLCSTVKWATTSWRALYELAFHYDRRHQNWTNVSDSVEMHLEEAR